MKIRTYQKEDKSAVIELWNACELIVPWNDPQQDIERKLAIQPELFLVGEFESQIIATAMAGYDGHRGSVYYLAVLPRFQGSGYGRTLMEKVESLLIERGCPKINISIRTSNEEVLAFYSSLGYKTDEVSAMGKRLIQDTDEE